MKFSAIRVLIAVVLAVTVFGALAANAADHPLLHKKAPEIVLKDTTGKEWKLSSLAIKNVVLLDFGRTTCIPCRLIAKDLEALHKKYEKRGLQVLAINLDGPYGEERVAQFIKDEKLTIPFLRDVEFKVAKDYQVQVIPHLVLVDRLGRIRYIHTGYSENLNKILSAKIEPLLPKRK